MVELSHASGLSRPTLTNYLKLGLLPPPLRISPTLYLYDDTHLQTLSLIRRFQCDEKLSLSEIKDALASGRTPMKPKKKPVAAVPVRGPLPADETGGKRQLIIDKAVRLFSIHGYENVKISDITDAIQIGKGTFYLYFKDKKELLHECFLEINTLLSASENDQKVMNEPDIVMRMKKRWLFFQKHYPHFGGLVQLLQTTAHSDDAVIRKRAIDSYNSVIFSIREDIRAAQAKEKIADLDPDLVAYAILGIMENITFRLNHEDNYPADAGADAVEELIRRILTPRR
jgi:AcrR family transcriptional regulator